MVEMRRRKKKDKMGCVSNMRGGNGVEGGRYVNGGGVVSGGNR